jgi:hypothetical protein
MLAGRLLVGVFCDMKVGDEIHADEVLSDRAQVPEACVFNNVDGHQV